MIKKIVLLVTFGLVCGALGALAGPVKDWKDLERIHKHVKESINEMERARAANHYDMQGHGAKAEDLLRQTEGELHLAVEAAKAGN
jgi:hypothetical protein